MVELILHFHSDEEVSFCIEFSRHGHPDGVVIHGTQFGVLGVMGHLSLGALKLVESIIYGCFHVCIEPFSLLNVYFGLQSDDIHFVVVGEYLTVFEVS